MKQIYQLSHATARRNAANAVMQAADGYLVEIKPRTRTLDQNACLWALLTELSKKLQWPVDGRMVSLTPEEWKHVMSAGLKRHQRVAMGIDGGFVVLGQSTSKMTKAELSELLELIHAFAAERGVELNEVTA